MTAITWLEREFWSTPPRPDAGRLPLASEVPVAPAAAARFERQDAELVLIVPISATEARNGSLVMVPAPGAPVRLRIPPGTRNGRRFRVRRVNAPAPDGFGDLTVVVEIS